MTIKKITKQDCINDLKRFYGIKGKPPKITDLQNQSEYISHHTHRRLFGSWSAALDAASLKPLNRPRNLTEDQMKDWLEKEAEKDTNGCWLWGNRVNPGGYGCIYYNGGEWLVHRLAYFLWKGEPEKLLVCHTCDNRQCYNPDHLFLGDHTDNNRDKIKKGRASKSHIQRPNRPRNMNDDDLFFWIKNITKKSDDCWIFPSLNGTGYGIIGIKIGGGNRTVMTHRWIFEYINKKSVALVGHRCNIRACCNPDHLYESNPSLNSLDTKSYRKLPKERQYKKI